MERLQTLRYGENPGQRAALYVTEEPRGMRDLTQRQGKELSFNNLLDLDAAMCGGGVLEHPARLLRSSSTRRPAASRSASTALEAFRKARATDPVSAFGSVIAFNTVVDRATAEAMSDLFVEVVVAPSFHDEALAVFAGKKKLRVVELPVSRGAGVARLQAGARRLPGAGPVPVRSLGPGLDGAPPSGSRPSGSGTTSASPGPPWRRSSRTPSCSPATRRRSASAPAR